MRQVSVAPRLLEKASADFPSGGSVDGAPTFEIFVRGPLEAAKFFARAFDGAPIPIPGVDSIRFWDTLSTFFGPLVFYALLVSDDRVEVIDYLSHPDYWALAGGGPAD